MADCLVLFPAVCNGGASSLEGDDANHRVHCCLVLCHIEENIHHTTEDLRSHSVSGCSLDVSQYEAYRLTLQMD